MKLSYRQLINMRAIAWLERQGNDRPTQKEIDEAENILLVANAAFNLTQRSSKQNRKEIYE
ncbi:MAG: hypothetical protein WC748_08320 [Legionellales bacterium]|jgi:hypothetical protein